MEKIWYLSIDGKEEGPYNLFDLKIHPKITPETPVRKEGSTVWIPIGKVVELKQVFEDAPSGNEEEEEDAQAKEVKNLRVADDMAVALYYEPPMFYFWLLAVLILLLYTIYEMYISN